MAINYLKALYVILLVTKGSSEPEQPSTEIEMSDQQFPIKRQSVRVAEQLSPEMVTNPKPEFYQGEIIEDDVQDGEDSSTQEKDIPFAVEPKDEDLSHPPNQQPSSPPSDSEPPAPVEVLNPDPIPDGKSEERHSAELL